MAERHLAMIGCGRIAHLLESDPLRYKPCTHLGAALRLQAEFPELSIRTLCDLDNNRLAQAEEFVLSEQTHNPLLTNDYQEALETAPDIAVIATTTESHFEILEKALALNIPAIVIEKPVCLNEKTAVKLAALAEKSKSRIWVNYERRYHPKYLKLKKIIDAKEFGFPLYYKGTFLAPAKSLFPKDKDDEGVLLHDTTHLLDLAFFLFGQPRTYQPADKRHLQHQYHNLLLEHEEGIVGDITTITHSPTFHFELQILFEEARITAGNGFYHIEKIKKSRHYENFFSLDSLKVKKEKRIKTDKNPFVRLYRKVMNGSEDANSFSDALLNVKILSGN